MLKLMYITGDAEVASIAQDNGVDRIFVDMEYIGKSERQGGLDTVQNHHTVEDVKRVRKVINRSQLLVRCNPIHEEGEEHTSSKDEINAVVSAGADIIMLPYFKTVDEVKTFLQLVGGRARTMLLFETPEAVENADEIIGLSGIDEVFIGLNDLSLGYGKKHMFELLADGTVEKLCLKFRLKGIPYGFGGIAALGKGVIPAEYVIKEHYRLGSTCSILSRSFCNAKVIRDINMIRSIFSNGMSEIRELEKECETYVSYFTNSRSDLIRIVSEMA